jgi:AcrR family transcriptional regulator
LTGICQLTYVTCIQATAEARGALYPHRTRRRLAPRDRLFEAAIAEFRGRGVAAAQIEAIVNAARVARGTFYLHFPTKDHVLLEVLRRGRRTSPTACRPRAGGRRAPSVFASGVVRLGLPHVVSCRARIAAEVTIAQAAWRVVGGAHSAGCSTNPAFHDANSPQGRAFTRGDSSNARTP